MYIYVYISAEGFFSEIELNFLSVTFHKIYPSVVGVVCCITNYSF